MTTRIDAIAGPGATAVPIEWVYPGAADLTWIRDTEHFTNPMMRFELWCYSVCGPGIDQAWAEAGLVPSSTVAPVMRWQFAGPFLYARVTPHAPERRAEAERRADEVKGVFGGSLRFWKDYCEPRIIAVCDEIAAAPEDADPAEIAARWAYGWHQTFTSLSPLSFDLVRLETLLTPVFGPGAELLTLEIAQGGANASQTIDAEVWALARATRADDEVRALITTGSPAQAVEALRQSPSARTVAAAFDALIARHESRSEGWSLDRPTWGERPDLAMALVRAQLGETAVAPEEVVALTGRLKAAAIARALDALPEADHARFHELAHAVAGNVEIREGRAYWQMVLNGRLRQWRLRLGARLVADGRLAQSDDVFFLEPDDLDATEGWLGDLIAVRRAEHAEWGTLTPPPFVGVLDAALTAEAAAVAGELRGMAASRGVVTGVARVMHSHEDWDALEPGEILVCAFTTPAWTPLFALAAAVVTESGDAVSHPAITAREYGIPAVVAAVGACTRIRDGDVITVDGSAGVVRLGK